MPLIRLYRQCKIDSCVRACARARVCAADVDVPELRFCNYKRTNDDGLFHVFFFRRGKV